MSKVLVDRELLERVLQHDFAEDCQECAIAKSEAWSELREAIAQPAEADGPSFAEALEQASVIQQLGAKNKRIDELQASLSAVTAERDRLRDQVKALQSDANSWQSGYDKGRHDGTKHRHSEVAQLRAEVEASRLLLEQCNEVIAEDGGVYIELRAFLAGTMPASDVIALLRDSAMSAKEA